MHRIKDDLTTSESQTFDRTFGLLNSGTGNQVGHPFRNGLELTLWIFWLILHSRSWKVEAFDSQAVFSFIPKHIISKTVLSIQLATVQTVFSSTENISCPPFKQ